jgi:dipeptidyl aminopeptidase/acylaminoacyl peptidase
MKRNCVLAALAIAGAVLSASAASFAQESPKTPWDLTRLSEPPKTYPAPDFQAQGVKALFYEGLPYKGNPTRVFAWYGAPVVEAGAKCPAMVLVHGGGGTAFDAWVRLWNQRGYAAIAMDTCGCTPGGENAKHPRHECGGPAGWGGFDQLDDLIEDQWPTRSWPIRSFAPSRKSTRSA